MHPPMMNCFGTSTVDELMAIISNICGIVIICSIGCISSRKLSSCAADRYEMHVILEILYFTEIVFACIVQIGSFLSIPACGTFDAYFQIAVLLLVVHLGYIVICSTLLASLIIRLYVTFLDSHWEIPKKKVAVSLLVLLLIDLFWISAGIAYWFCYIEMAGFYLMVFIGLTIFILDSMWAVYHFTSNLLSLAKERAATKLELQLHPEFSQRPQKLIRLSSKYVALYMVATGTSVLSFVLTATFRMILHIHPGFHWSIDCVVNTICLYLYHNFAANHYEQFCSGLDLCCRWKMTENVKMDFVRRKIKITLAITKRQSEETSTAEYVNKNQTIDVMSSEIDIELDRNENGRRHDHQVPSTDSTPQSVVSLCSELDAQSPETASSPQSICDIDPVPDPDPEPEGVDCVRVMDTNTTKIGDEEDFETKTSEIAMEYFNSNSQSTAF